MSVAFRADHLAPASELGSSVFSGERAVDRLPGGSKGRSGRSGEVRQDQSIYNGSPMIQIVTCKSHINLVTHWMI